jgi:TrmH family RNA methyltransferase
MRAPVSPADPILRSRQNPTVQALRRLAASAEARREEIAYLADGVRLVEEGVRSGAPITLAVCSPRLLREARGERLQGALRRAAERLVLATDEVVAAIVGAPRHQGVVIRLQLEAAPLATHLDPARSDRAVIACGVQDPGNLGALLRVAAASGAGLLVAATGSADPWSPKAARASAGALFRLPVARGGDPGTVLAQARAAGYRVVAAHARGGTPYREVDWGHPTALFLGGEGGGLPEEILEACDERATIPMATEVESLNVLSAATLLLYAAAEASGRRREGSGSRPGAARRR